MSARRNAASAARERDFQEWARMPGSTMKTHNKGAIHLEDGGIWWQVENLRHRGNSIIEYNPREAVYLYTEAIRFDDDRTFEFQLLNPRERATLHSNRCHALTKLGDLQNAFQDAIACVKVDPTFQKGYWRVATVMKQMNRQDEAMEALIDGYPKILGSDKKAISDRVDFVYEITVLAVKLWTKWKKSQFLFRTLDVSTSVWTTVVQRLAKNREYEGLRLVFLLGGTQSGRTYEIGQGGAATGCDTSAIDLRSIVRGLSSAQDTWSMHLVLELIKHGSKVEGLSQKEGDTPLHCAVENVLRTGWVKLLEHLFNRVYKTNEQRNFPDRFGNSLFHVVAKTTGQLTHAKTAVAILQKYDVDPLRIDRRGCTPIDLVPVANGDVRRLLNEAVATWTQKELEKKRQQQQQQWQQQQQQQQQQARNMSNQRYPAPRFAAPGAASTNNWTGAQPFPPQPQTRAPFFDPSKIFGSAQAPPKSPGPRPGPAPFFDHSRMFGETQKPTWQQEELLKQKQREEQQRKQAEQMRQEELRRQREAHDRLRREVEEVERQRQQKAMEEERKRQQKAVEERKQQQRLEDERRRQEEKQQKEKERKERIRLKQEEKKRRDNQKRKEKRELQRKKEEEARKDAYQKGLNLQNAGKHDEAISQFLDFISKNHRSSVVYREVDRCVNAFLESLERVQEIPDTVQCTAPPTFWNTTVERLADSNKWWSLFLLLVGGSYSANRNGHGVAHGCDASKVSIVAFLNEWEKMNMAPGRIAMVTALLENDARPNGLLNDPETPLVLCLRMENYELVNLLLKNGAAPSQLITDQDQGDTPLHSALKIGFKQDDRRFTMLDFLLNKYSSDPTSAMYLDKNAQDSAGNTLFHVALTGGSKNQSLNAVKLLSAHKLNPWLRNHKGKVPIEMVSVKDRRYMYLTEAAKYYKETSSSTSKADRGSDHSSQPEGIKVYGVPDDWSKLDEGLGQDRHQRAAKPAETVPQKERLRREVEELLSAMPVFVPKQLDRDEARTTTPVASPPRTGAQQVENGTAAERNEVEEDEGEDEDEDADEEEEDREEEEEERRMEIDANIFDDLIWEVECTAKVWKFLRDKQVLHSLKETAIRKIQILGSGDWRGRLCKPLEGLPKQRNMKLYEARLTKGGRILWELAIAFSPRCSEECEKRLESGDGYSEGTAVAGGRVYSEIIRIWDIVPDHPKVAHAIEVIVKSVERGEECIIRKNLVGFSNKVAQGGTTVQRLPTYFREVTGNSPDRGTKSRQDDAKKIPRPYFPPASSRENEYHIMKFYSVTSTLVNAVLNDSTVKVDFPFRVTELEHAIINLQPKPPSSILLLGRSGTGKTTCCLYRLWTKFFKYWQQASKIGEPWIPRDVAFIHQDKMEEEEDENNSGDDSEQVSSTAFQVDSASSFSRDRFGSGASTDVDYPALTNGMSGDGDGDGIPMIMDHLHQIFVTKNAVLCSEVQRNFYDMAHACEFASEPLTQQDTPIPHRLQDAHQARFPLFLSSRQFLLLLDASLPNPYFPRAADGSLKRKIRGWDEEDGPLTFIPLMDEDEDEEEEENAVGANDEDTTQEGVAGDDIHPNAALGQGLQHANQGGGKAKYDPRREITYEVFAYELWPRINKKKLPYHSTLVWMEITSFIKGSVEALHTESGFLSLESYLALGQKRASNFTGDREEIYNLFKTYEHVKSQKNLFDEGDLVFHVYRRLRDAKGLDWAVHEIYVDETQDFTQAELALFIRCAHDPNALFLTGDTAQSIMRGVAFRFDDLKSLFHYASKSVKALGKHSAVTVPKRVYQLTHNYRSHAGILNLASTIVDLMTHFFPNSFDRLERDQGLFHGPSPVLLESCSFSDLALLLCGNKRKTSEIEFGAHQVILVANEEAIEKLPAELRLGLVMTIYEAKGLEFDDVLLYNFFKDSPAEKEWRVITDYLNELITQQQNSPDEPREALKEIDLDSLTVTNRPRPLKFNPDEHKVLNSELKYLYTAITRARVNVWIFDEDQTKRAPMFELFRCRKLVKVIRPESEDEDGSTELDAMFVEKSTETEWVKRGDYFFQNKLWMVAAKCYQRGGDEKKELQARAHHQAVEAERMRDQLYKMREKFLLSASLFLRCDSSKMAVNCLYNAREFGLLAQLFEKRGEFSKAARIYEKRLNRVSDACRCLEMMGDYAKALDLLCSIGLHSKALDVVDRFNRFKQEQIKMGETLPRHIKPPGSTHSLNEMIYRSADYHYKQGDRGQMLDALEQLDQFDARVNFLRKRGLFPEAVKLLKEEGHILEAAKILREQGKLEEACTILESSDNREFVAECRLSQAKKLLADGDDDDNQTAAISLLAKAEGLFNRCDDSVKKAETQLLLGQLQKDSDKIKKARLFFNRMPHTAGESECLDLLLKLTPPDVKNIKSRLFQPLRSLLQLICVLFECSTGVEERQRQVCQEFFGLVPAEDDKLHIQRCEGARIVWALGKNLPQVSEVEAEKAWQGIAKYCLIPRALRWLKLIRELLYQERKQLTQCKDYAIGMPCRKHETCQKLHKPYTYPYVGDLVNCLVQLIEIDDIVETASRALSFKAADKLAAEILRSEKVKVKNCKALYDVFYPEHCHQRFIGQSSTTVKDLLYLIHRPVIKKQLKAYAENERKKADHLRQRADTDLYLMCHGIHQLIGEGSKVIGSWVTKEERDCLDWQKKEGWKHPLPLGMHMINPHERTKGYMSYKRRHLDSFESLYVKRDAMESLTSFNRFMGTPANKPMEPVLPSISNTVAMIEAKITMALALGAKSYQCNVAVPASYLAQATFLDAVNCPGKGHAMYTAVNNTTVDKHTPGQVRALVDLVCGTGKLGRNFSVLADAFSSVEYINTGEAERTLVLVLVMLCNAGLGLPPPVIRDTRCALQSIAPSEEHLPKRVFKALHKIQSAQSRHDALYTLQELLTARDAEYLRDCRWEPRMPPRGSPGLDFQKQLNVKSFENVQFETLGPKSPTVFTEQGGDNGHQRGKAFDEEEDDDMSKEEGPEDESEMEEEAETGGLGVSKEEAAKAQMEQEMLQREQKKQAVKVIMPLLKAAKLLRLARLLRSCGYNELTIQQDVQSMAKKAANEWVSKQLIDFLHTSVRCTICDVNLRDVQEIRPERDDATEALDEEGNPKEEIEDSSPTEAVQTPEPEAEIVYDLPTQEEHEATVFHQERHGWFLQYGQMLRDEVYPLYSGVEKLLNDIGYPALGSEATGSTDNLQFFEESLSGHLKDLTNKMAEIQGKRAFEQLEEVRLVVQQLQKVHSEVKDRYDKQVLEQERAADEGEDITAEGLDIQEEDAINIEEEEGVDENRLAPVSEEPADMGKGGRNKGRNQKQKKGKWNKSLGRGRKR